MWTGGAPGGAESGQLAHVLAVVRQLLHRFADVRQRGVRAHLAHAFEQRRCPAPCQLLERGHVEVAVVEIAFQPRHVPDEEPPVLADRIAADRRPALGNPLAQERDRAFLGVGHRRVAGEHAAPQAGTAMRAAVPFVHGLEPRERMRDRQFGAFGEHVQLAVGDQRGDLQDRIGVGIEPGHLEVDPDQVLLVGGHAWLAGGRTRHHTSAPFRPGRTPS